MGSNTGSMSDITEISYIFFSLDPLCDQLNTKRFIILKPRPTRRTLFDRNGFADWMCPTSKVAFDMFITILASSEPSFKHSSSCECEAFLRFLISISGIVGFHRLVWRYIFFIIYFAMASPFFSCCW